MEKPPETALEPCSRVSLEPTHILDFIEKCVLLMLIINEAKATQQVWDYSYAIKECKLESCSKTCTLSD